MLVVQTSTGRSFSVRRRAVCAGSLVIALSIASAAPAIAAPKDTPAAKPKTIAERLAPEPRKHFESATILFGDGNFVPAMTEFNAAYEASKEPRILRNIALCEKNLKHYSKALALLERELAEATDLEPSIAADLKSDIEALAALTTTTEITVSEAGAEVFVDESSVGTSPLSAAVRVDVGDRTFVAKKAGFLDAVVKVSAVSGTPAKVSLKLELVKKVGKVHVETSGLGATDKATVTIDGVDRGTAPLDEQLGVGKHEVVLSAKGFVTQKQLIDVTDAGTTTIRAKLEAEKHEGTLAIETGDTAASILLDGKVIGSGAFVGKVASGGHQLIVKRDGYKTFQDGVTILDNQQRTVNVTLEKESSTWYWWVGGAVVAAGLGTGAYFLFRPKNEQPVAGTLNPGVVSLSLGHWK